MISASDDRYWGLYAVKQAHKWFNDQEYPSLGLRRGVRTLQRITVDNKYTIVSLHTNNNDYYHICQIQLTGSINMKETTFQYSYTMTSDLDSLLFHWNTLRLPLQGVI